MDHDHIDRLLERYLALLDEYTALRATLGGTQAGMYQNIARANFAAERGMRYGPDSYDDRMQASRTVSITLSEEGVPCFEVAELPVSESTGAPDGEKQAESSVSKRRDPLRWFGILAPMPLRQAQTQSVQAVQEVIPRLVSVNAEMVGLEIEIRRARKKRAKTEAAQEKIGLAQTQHAESGISAATAEA